MVTSDGQRELRRLAVLQKHSSGCLAFATFRYRYQIRLVETALRRALGDRPKVRHVAVDLTSPAWLDRLLREAGGRDSVRSVRGLDGVTAENARELNFHRERFAGAGTRFLFWIRPQDIDTLATYARDFWAWRSAVFSFVEEPLNMGAAFAIRRAEDVTREQPRGDPSQRASDLARRLDVERARADPDWALVGNLALGLGWAYLDLHLPRQARGFFEDALRVSVDKADSLTPRFVAAANVGCGEAAASLGELGVARRFLEAGIRAWRAAGVLTKGDARALFGALVRVGEVYEALGSARDAESAYSSAIEHAPDEAALAVVRNKLGCLMLGEGRHLEARAQLEGALKAADPDRAARLRAMVMNNLGMLAVAERHYETAASLLGKSARLKQDAHDLEGASVTLQNLALLTRLQGRAAEAERYASRSREVLQISQQTQKQADHKLLRLVLAGDSAAAEEILRRLKESLKRRSYFSMTPLEPADMTELMYAAFALLWEQLREGRSDLSLTAEIERAAHGAMSRMARASALRTVSVEDIRLYTYDDGFRETLDIPAWEVADLWSRSEPGPEDVLEGNLEFSAFGHILGELGPNGRDLAHLHFVQQLSCAQIARVYGVSEATMRTTLARLRSWLRRRLTEERLGGAGENV